MTMIKFLGIAGLLLLSCKNGDPQSAAATVAGNRSEVEGLWISKTYTDSLAAHPNARFNNSHGCTELFIKNNTVFVLNGEWQPEVCHLQKLPSGNGKVYRIASQRPDSFVDFSLVNGRLIQQEPFHYGSYCMVFVRPDPALTDAQNSAGFSSAFRQTANQKLLSGNWKVVVNSPVPPERGQAVQVSPAVTFYPDGHIDGLGEYKYYKICTEGDCKRYCDEMTLVYLSQYADLPGGKWYCWTRQGNRLEIYHAISKEWMSNWPDIQPYGDSWLVLNKTGD